MIRMLALAWRGLIHEPMHLLCNVMIVCGALTPLLVLQGVKSGVYSSLIANLESNPNLLLVSTLGDRSFAEDDAEVVRNWPETNFAVLRTRGISDTVTVQALSDGPVRQASAVPTAPGDPALPNNLDMADNEVALTALLAETTGVTAGDAVRIVARSEARPAPLVMEATVATVVPRDRMTGISVLIDLARLDDIEAYYDGYALPQHGLDDGRDASERVPEFEGLRLYARTMTEVAALERRIVERRDRANARARTQSRQSVPSNRHHGRYGPGISARIRLLGGGAARASDARSIRARRIRSGPDSFATLH